MHTDQTVCNNNTRSYDYFSPYYPEDVIPNDHNDPDLEFFKIDKNGSPSDACIQAFNDPDDPDLYEIETADGIFPYPQDDPAMEWNLKSYLYKKIKSDSNFLNSYANFDQFLQENAGTNIGYFYEVNHKIDEAFEASDTLKQNGLNIYREISAFLDSIRLIDDQIEVDTQLTTISGLDTSKLDYLNNIIGLMQEYDTIYQGYKVIQISKLEEADSLNQDITPTALALEVYEQQVNHIYLQSIINDENQLDSTTIQTLKDIGGECPNYGGMAVYKALSLLPPCELLNLETCPLNLEFSYDTIFIPLPEEQIVRTINENQKPLIVPNPTIANFRVNLPLGEPKTIVEIFSMEGRSIYKQNISALENVVYIENLIQTGVYIVKLQLTNGNSITRKLFVNSK